MSRWVVAKRPGLRSEEATNAGPKDDALGRIAKYVPGEVLGAFTLLFTLLVSLRVSDELRPWVAVGLIVLFLIVTLAYIMKKAPEGEVRTAHLVVSPLAFLAWSYPISSSALGDLFLPIVAFVAQAIVIALSLFIRPQSR